MDRQMIIDLILAAIGFIAAVGIMGWPSKAGKK
jgi:DMSO reductase anchor subunit